MSKTAKQQLIELIERVVPENAHSVQADIRVEPSTKERCVFTGLEAEQHRGTLDRIEVHQDTLDLYSHYDEVVRVVPRGPRTVEINTLRIYGDDR